MKTICKFLLFFLCVPIGVYADTVSIKINNNTNNETVYLTDATARLCSIND